MTVGYVIALVMALGLLVAYAMVVRGKDIWLGLLFVCVTVVNLGYLLLSVASNLPMAILANDVAYLGSVFLSMCMLFSIVRLCGSPLRRWHVILAMVVGVLMFALVATSGLLPWYYADVQLETVDGATRLVKTYGVLHPVYTVYLLGYFGLMIATIIRSVQGKRPGSQKLAGVLAGVVCGNILVWLFEKFLPLEFEFLAVTYIFSELILLLLYWMMQDYVLVRDIPKFTPAEQKKLGVDIATMPMEEKIGRVLLFVKEGEPLSAREREILEMILDNKRRKEIAAEIHLSENTVKTYTRTLYLKLGVTSRSELYALLLKERVTVGE